MKIPEVLEKPPLILAGLCYIVGLLVVTFYLQGFGISSSISLFRVSYLLAGAWVLIPLFFFWILWMVVDYNTLVHKPKNPTLLNSIILPYVFKSTVTEEEAEGIRKDDVSCLVLVLTVFILGLIGFVAWAVGVEVRHWEWLAIYFCAFIWQLTVGLIFGTVNQSRANNRNGIGIPIVILISVLSVLVFFVYLYYFAILTYKYIPSFAGGGKPIEVRLVVEPSVSTQSQFRELGAVIDAKTGMTNACSLLYTSEDEYILLLGQDKNQHAVTIRRDSVKAVLYQSRH